MSKVLLDTDILSEYLKGYDKIVARHAANYARQHGAFTFTSVTVHEIVFGLEFKGASGQLGKALLWLNQNEQITPTGPDFYEAALIKAKARKQGSILELSDCLIAAVAIRLGLPLVTGNTEDFQAVQRTGVRLIIENWREG
jgi:predicted nucleic acid-binding protein